ncbi:hypothetical protein, partial [Pseudomonas syringae]
TAAKLIHNCWGKNQQSILGQFSIGRVGQFSISANTLNPFAWQALNCHSQPIKVPRMKKTKLLNRAICIAFFPLAALAGNAFADSGSASAGTGSSQSAADQRAAMEAAAEAAKRCGFVFGQGHVCD